MAVTQRTKAQDSLALCEELGAGHTCPFLGTLPRLNGLGIRERRRLIPVKGGDCARRSIAFLLRVLLLMSTGAAALERTTDQQDGLRMVA